MGTQTVVRTYPKGWNVTNERLKKLLNDGYKVSHITPLPDGIIEYIVEQKSEDKAKCPLDLDIQELVRERDELLNERNAYKLLYEDYREEQDKDDWGK